MTRICGIPCCFILVTEIQFEKRAEREAISEHMGVCHYRVEKNPFHCRSSSLEGRQLLFEPLFSSNFGWSVIWLEGSGWRGDVSPFVLSLVERGHYCTRRNGGSFQRDWRKTRLASGGTKKTEALLRDGISLLRRRQCVVGKFLPLSSCVVRCQREEVKDQDGSARRVSLCVEGYSMEHGCGEATVTKGGGKKGKSPFPRRPSVDDGPSASVPALTSPPPPLRSSFPCFPLPVRSAKCPHADEKEENESGRTPPPPLPRVRQFAVGKRGDRPTVASRPVRVTIVIIANRYLQISPGCAEAWRWSSPFSVKACRWWWLAAISRGGGGACSYVAGRKREKERGVQFSPEKLEAINTCFAQPNYLVPVSDRSRRQLCSGGERTHRETCSSSCPSCCCRQPPSARERNTRTSSSGRRPRLLGLSSRGSREITNSSSSRCC